MKIEPTYSFITELWRLREGLQLVRDNGLANVEVELDSEAVVKSIKVTWMWNQGCPLFYLIASGCFKAKVFWALIAFSRKVTNLQDFIANLGQRSNWGTLVLDHLPEDLKSIL